MLKKKWVSGTLAVCLAASYVLMAGSNSKAAESADFSGKTIEIATYLSGDTLNAYKEVISGFENETGVKVTLDEYGDDYESTMKTIMASNDLPDIFETHGWSLIRYKEYLTDLSEESWAGDLNKAARGVIEDTDGKIYTLMTTGSCLGTAVNMNVCEAAGVDPWSIETWEDFNAACDKIKEAGYTPIANYFTSAGALANADGSWLNYEGEQFDDSAAMLDGTWDWANYKVVLDYLQTWFDNGYLYEDCGTIKQADAIERCAKNECAFIVGIGTSYQAAVVAQNPDVKIVAVEPASSPVLSEGHGGPHKIQGIGAGFVPEVLDTKIYDEIIPVENDDAFKVGQEIGHNDGVLVGISSGAAVWAAIELAKRPENEGKTIVALLPDTGDRYLSTPLFAE